ncbi:MULTISPECIES: hypothetical protein [Micromonospora]|uniref:Uncharacterized protein n=1 Tax=Micromonospora sediminimaris TaxID=547162 RepID=A0A9W5XMF0_9ACTN|nr:MULTISPECIES: hypothetical protein [Micromonospora]WFE47483.1 hypothetical protein O7624_25740 [Verrucosispora sp. WMMD1129]GIJ36546.1 hypothetical protein Vse01_56940 [Micromonospora sediminimaris]SFD22734.1 hypothetical protein SAMN05216284_11364 [Micromonospora sediminimaris]
MPDISLPTALSALIRDLQRSTSGAAEDSVDVELHLVTRENGSGVTWHLAPVENTHAHRIRLTLYPWRQPRHSPVPRHRQPHDIEPGNADRITRGADETEVGLDPNWIGSAQLPPIVRPKPGVDIERDDH